MLAEFVQNSLQDGWGVAIAALWLAWCALWAVLWFTTKRAIKRETIWQRIVHLTPVVLAVVLLCTRQGQPRLLCTNLLPPATWQGALGLAITIAGLAFTIWARFTIGRNWSATVTIKAQHELICKGPYALVRHPIYSGFLAAVIGTAIEIDQARAWLGFALLVLCLVPKRRTEEAFMRSVFGGAYDAYAARVPALVPWGVGRRSSLETGA